MAVVIYKYIPMTKFYRRLHVVELVVQKLGFTPAYARKLIFYARKQGLLRSDDEISHDVKSESLYTVREAKRWVSTLK